MKTFLSIIVASAFFAIAGGTPAHAQVIDSIEADIPFGFTIKGATLPAGHYTIKRFISSDPDVMEILDASYGRPLLFMVGSAQVLREPQRTELIFERIGDQYFLSKVFEEGDSIGVEVPKSRAERQLEKEGALTQVQTVTVSGQNGLNAKR